MNSEILKLKKKLDDLLSVMPIQSQEILNLSQEVDRLIIEYYTN